MIQRIQTIFILLVVASMTTFLFVPQWAKMDAETGESYSMTPFYYTSIESDSAEAIITYVPYGAVGLFASLIIIIGIVQIFKFKNRVLQMKLGMLNAFLIVGTLAGAGWFWYTLGRQMLPHIPVGFELGLILPAIAMVFNRMAMRFIKKDEDLVRSVDRIR